jgi:hypothetical protein
MRSATRTLAVAALAAMVIGSASQAAVMLNAPRIFTGVGNVDGWVSDMQGGGTPHVSVQNPGGSYLETDFLYSGPPVPLNPLINNSSSPYIGDWSIADTLQFDFIAFDFAPAAGLAIRFTGVNGAVWAQTFNYTSAQVGDWVHYALPLSAAAWTLQSGSSDFMAALGNVASAQLSIEGSVGDGGSQQFGLDNWQYTIPEPGTVAMLGAALLGLATTFRRQIQGGIAQMKKG